MKYSFFVIFCIIGLLIVSCSNQSDKLPTVEVNGFEIADLDPNLLTTVDAKLSQIADNIKVVPLETNPECLLSGDVDFQIGEKYIIAKNNSNEGVCQFSIDGSFIRKIISYGSAPGEFPGMPLLCIAEKEDLLLALRPDLIYYYELSSGSLLGISDIPLLNPGELLSECRYLGDSLILVSYRKFGVNETENNKCGVKIKTLGGELLWQKEFDYGSRYVLSFENINSLFGSKIDLLSTDNIDEYIIHIQDQDTVYLLNTSTYSFKPNLLKRFEKVKIEGFPVDGVVANCTIEEQEFARANGFQLMHYIYVKEMSDNSSLMSGERFFILYDDKAGQAYKIGSFENDFLGFNHDMEVGNDDSHYLPVLSSPKGKLVEVYDAFSFLNFANEAIENSELDKQVRKRLMDITYKVKESSNPVLLIGDMNKQIDL